VRLLSHASSCTILVETSIVRHAADAEYLDDDAGSPRKRRRRRRRRRRRV